MNRFLAIVVLLSGLSFGSASVQADPAAMTLLQRTSEQLLDALRDNRAEIDRNPGRIYRLVNEVVLPHFDFPTMSRWVLGKHWRSASDQQRHRFTDEFARFLVSTYAKALLAYSDEEIRYLSVKPLKRGRVMVRTEIIGAGATPVPINYGMKKSTGGDWKVYNVVVDGISLVTNYRNSFSSQIRKEGIDALIARLNQRNASVGS